MDGLLLSDDLIDTSRIAGTARALGLTVVTARATEPLLRQAREQSPACVLLDLKNPRLDVPGLLAALREACPVLPRVVAFGSHVDAASLKAARDAGCDLVLPRSAFFEKLPEDLPVWLRRG
jgi:CheY-like chemotaxis protein